MLFLGVESYNNMKKFTQLTLTQRYRLEALLKVEPKLKQKEITFQL
jgi:hypothetical protein